MTFKAFTWRSLRNLVLFNVFNGARGEIRTLTPLRAGDFESPASTIPPLGQHQSCPYRARTRFESQNSGFEAREKQHQALAELGQLGTTAFGTGRICLEIDQKPPSLPGFQQRRPGGRRKALAQGAQVGEGSQVMRRAACDHIHRRVGKRLASESCELRQGTGEPRKGRSSPQSAKVWRNAIRCPQDLRRDPKQRAAGLLEVSMEGRVIGKRLAVQMTHPHLRRLSTEQTSPSRVAWQMSKRILGLASTSSRMQAMVQPKMMIRTV